MNDRAQDAIRNVRDLCESARRELGDRGSFRLRVLLDLVLLDLAREVERQKDRDRPTGP